MPADASAVAFFAAGLAAAGAAPAPLPRIAAMMSAGLLGAAAAAGFASALSLEASAPPAPLARIAAMISAAPFGAAAGFAGSFAGAESSAGAAAPAAGSAGAVSLWSALFARDIFKISSVVSFFAIIPSHRVQNRLPAGVRRRGRNSSPDNLKSSGQLRLEMSGRLKAAANASVGKSEGAHACPLRHDTAAGLLPFLRQFATSRKSALRDFLESGRLFRLVLSNRKQSFIERGWSSSSNSLATRRVWQQHQHEEGGSLSGRVRTVSRKGQ